MMNENVIVEFLKTIAKPVSKNEIIEATKFDGDFRHSIAKLRRQYSEIETIGSTNQTKYFWKSEEKNQEGYSDPTASKALKNVMRSSGTYPMRQQFGEIWSTSTVTDDQEGFLVISAKDGTCICYKIYPERKVFMKNRWTFKWSDDIGPHYVSTINIFNVNERKLDRKISELTSEEKAALTDFVRSAVDITPSAETTDSKLETALKESNERNHELELLLGDADEKNMKLEERNQKLRDHIEDLQQKLAAAIVPEASTSVDKKDVELAVLRGKLEVYERLFEAWMKK